MHSEYKLAEITVNNGIFGGYSFRGKIENVADGEVAVIQMKDLTASYSKINHTPVRVKGDKIKARYHLQKEDILFIAKGANNYALVYDLDMAVAIASSAFFILRIDQKIANPYFVAWYMNRREAQQFIKENMAGTYIPNVNIDTVKNLKIRIPSPEKQNYIARLDQLIKREQEIIKMIRNKRKELLETVLYSLIRE